MALFLENSLRCANSEIRVVHGRLDGVLDGVRDAIIGAAGLAVGLALQGSFAKFAGGVLIRWKP